MAGGMNAPPTMAVHNTPDPCGLPSPRSSMANVKMVGNMMLLQTPTANTDNNAETPDKEMDVTIKSMANKPAPASNVDGFIRRMSAEPTNRPTMAPPQ